MQLHELDHLRETSAALSVEAFTLSIRPDLPCVPLFQLSMRIEHGIGLMQHQHRTFLDQIEILVGHDQGDFEHASVSGFRPDISISIQTR
jgi:hypothetical protein